MFPLVEENAPGLSGWMVVLFCLETGVEMISIITIEMRLKEGMFFKWIYYYIFATKYNVISIVSKKQSFLDGQGERWFCGKAGA
ncbi:hypothetical protein [Oceanobacillus sp. CF4.6]|uniref:hypothetical protein n=1 Tax=Oceanobacillus sp. CF4.6 TaxID=3373080 RepID=UPI003EE4F1C1